MKAVEMGSELELFASVFINAENTRESGESAGIINISVLEKSLLQGQYTKRSVSSCASSKHWGNRIHNTLLHIILCNIKCLEMNIRFRNNLINRMNDCISEDFL